MMNQIEFEVCQIIQVYNPPNIRAVYGGTDINLAG